MDLIGEIPDEWQLVVGGSCYVPTRSGGIRSENEELMV